MHNRLFILFLLCGACLLAQNVRLAMEEPPYYKNSPFRFQVSFINETPDEPPKFDDSQDFAIKAFPPQNSTSTQVSIINGKHSETKTVTTTYTYNLTPKKTGTLTIPSLAIVLKGDRKSYRAKTIQVDELNTNDKVTLTQKIGKTVCAVGEPIRVEYTWTSTANIENYELTIPFLDLENIDIEPVPLTQRQENSRGAMFLQTTKGTRIPAFQQSKQGNLVITFAITVIPRKHGTFSIPPTTIVCEAIDTSRRPQRRTRRGFFDDPFFDSPFSRNHPTVKCSAESQPLTLTVKEPPADNRPASYTGLAEPCTIATTADKTDVYVGDPIVLSITLKGPRFPNSIILPKLSQNKNFETRFRVFDNDAPGQLNPDNSITFQRTIRATSTEVTAIPPVEIAWFDANDNAYHTAQSTPIPISVKATKRATAITSNDTPVAEPEKIEVTARQNGLKPNFPPEECLQNQFKPHQEAPFQPELFLLSGMPVALLLIIAAKQTFAYRKRHAGDLRSKNAASIALKRLPQSPENTEDFQQILQAFTTYVAFKAKLNPDVVTLQETNGLLDAIQAPDSLRNDVQRLFNACEAAIYAKQRQISPEEAKSLAIQLIKQLDSF